jgi:hypothetical protein
LKETSGFLYLRIKRIGRNIHLNFIRRGKLNQEKDTEQFHDSESENVYDLYNACNGVMHEGRLDIRKLDELSPEELKVLDVVRLREVWEHTAGCAECERIINILNEARGISRAPVDEPSQERIPVTDISYVEL